MLCTRPVWILQAWWRICEMCGTTWWAKLLRIDLLMQRFPAYKALDQWYELEPPMWHNSRKHDVSRLPTREGRDLLRETRTPMSVRILSVLPTISVKSISLFIFSYFKLIRGRIIDLSIAYPLLTLISLSCPVLSDPLRYPGQAHHMLHVLLPRACRRHLSAD